MDRPFERREDAFAEMADDICQQVQPAPMRHSHRDVFNAQFACTFDQLIKQGNDRLASFD